MCVSAQVLTMVPLYAPLQKVVPASRCSLVQYHVPVKVERGTSRYEMDVEVGLEFLKIETPELSAHCKLV